MTPQSVAEQILLDYHRGEEALLTVDSDHDRGRSAGADRVDEHLHHRGEAAEIASGVRGATGRAPRDFRGFVHDHVDAFGG